MKKSEQPTKDSSDTSVESPVKKLDTQIAELTNDLQRTRADFENFRKQTELQKSKAMTMARETTVLRLLPLLDDIDRAIATYPEQLSPLTKVLAKTLSELKLEKIDSNPDTEFDPDLHEAVMVEDIDGDREVISETLRPGYKYEQEVIRPAMVKVKRVL